MLRLWPLILALASCGADPAGDNAAAASAVRESEGTPYKVEEIARFEQPWAVAVEPGTGTIFVTKKAGAIAFVRRDGTRGSVAGLPDVDHGGQGGMGDIVFAPDYRTSRMVYLSWVERGRDGTRGAAVGRAKLACAAADACTIGNLEVIWRQQPKVTGRGHFSQRIAFSPDGTHLFIASGDRQKMTPAQDLTNNLGSIVRLLPDGKPAPDNPFASRGGVAAQIWSYGHRNILGLAFAPDGRLWAVEHGPAGGDEFNLVRPGANYGWPLVAQGDHYDGTSIPRHTSRPDLAAPAASWSPVIAPGGFIFYDGAMFTQWRGNALIAGLKSQALVVVAIEGETAREIARYDFGKRLRAIAQAQDGAVLIAEDGPGGRLLRLTPR